MTTPGSLGAGSIESRIAVELGVRERQVKAAVELLDGGSTVPFIARYRKGATEMLDDAQLRSPSRSGCAICEELEERRTAILESVRGGASSPRNWRRGSAAPDEARLEDVYLPYKPKRRTKAQIAAGEAGLEPLADGLLGDPTVEPLAAAAAVRGRGQGRRRPAGRAGGRAGDPHRAVLEDADLIGELRERMWVRGRLAAKVREGKEEAGAKFADYFDFTEPFTELPSHRILAMLRGEKEGGARPRPGARGADGRPVVVRGIVAAKFGIADRGRPADK